MPALEYLLELQEAVRDQLGCGSRHVGTTRVVEEVDHRVLWEGDVETFMLLGHPLATRCFSWIWNQADAPRVMIVLEITPVNGPFSAVKTSLSSQQNFAC